MMCYFECILRMGNVMRGSKINVSAMRRLARTMLPTEYKPMVLPSIEACLNTDEGEACETAYAFVKCHHKESGPQGFMFG